MLKSSFKPLQRSSLSIRCVSNSSFYLQSETTPTSKTVYEHKLSHKELREQAIAEALAREEEAIEKSKRIRELTEETKELITTLNKTPTTLMKERISKLNQDLSKISQNKVKQLDEELRDYMTNNMKLTNDILANRPWLKQQTNQQKQIQDSKQRTSTSSSSNQFTSQYPNLKPTPDYKDYSPQELYLRQLNYLRSSGNLGSKLENIYKPQNDTHRPPKISETTIKNLMAAGCHLGHSTSSFNPKFQPFLYGTYNGIHLIDLNQTFNQLKLACKIIEGIIEKGGIVLYVGTHKNWSIQESLVKAAERSKSYYVSKRWIPGTITNYLEVSKQIKDPLMKQTIDMNDNQIHINQQQNNSIIKPDLVVILNPTENNNCINECISSNIPTIGLCDSNMNPRLLTYPIPCNDENIRSVNLMLGIMSKAGESGLNKRLNIIKKLKDEERQILEQ
ncbi:uncharacterized protein KGF55_002967 [Candida pseudojiufengensis]|uniref:uncharacterized protein n=1 Tax=Candida pseudojiufengensis TaxID=497109 RepID=UPI0022253EBE|nr:uncharacterized protein KGF55_002967 [Candida pseudojiufengensis]KAI5963175.1 hypothetical protein KGF55_002967 [Candida pseudojiufengensis]